MNGLLMIVVIAITQTIIVRSSFEFATQAAVARAIQLRNKQITNEKRMMDTSMDDILQFIKPQIMYKELFDSKILSVQDVLRDFRLLDGIPVVQNATDVFDLDSVYSDYNDSIMVGGTVNDTCRGFKRHFLSVKVRITVVEAHTFHDKEEETYVVMWFDNNGRFVVANIKYFAVLCWASLQTRQIESIAHMIKGQSLKYEHLYGDEYGVQGKRVRIPVIITRHDLNRTTPRDPPLVPARIAVAYNSLNERQSTQRSTHCCSVQ
eukprot:742633_1